MPVRFCLLGSNGDISGAVRPMTMSSNTTHPPTNILGFIKGCRGLIWRRWRVTSGPEPEDNVVLAVKADPRVGNGVEHVDDEIDDDEGDRVGQHRPGDQRIVPRVDRRDQKLS